MSSEILEMPIADALIRIMQKLSEEELKYPDHRESGIGPKIPYLSSDKKECKWVTKNWSKNIIASNRRSCSPTAFIAWVIAQNGIATHPISKKLFRILSNREGEEIYNRWISRKEYLLENKIKWEDSKGAVDALVYLNKGDDISGKMTMIEGKLVRDIAPGDIITLRGPASKENHVRGKGHSIIVSKVLRYKNGKRKHEIKGICHLSATDKFGRGEHAKKGAIQETWLLMDGKRNKLLEKYFKGKEFKMYVCRLKGKGYYDSRFFQN